jgi:drug/metabolite transporter (DMT)-like permease
MQHKLTPRIALLLTLPPLLWAGNAVVGRLAVGIAPPVALNAVRWLIAALLLLPLASSVLRDGRVLSRGRVGYLLLLGGLGMGSYNAFQYLALTTSTPVNVTLIAASMPVWMLLIGMLGYRIHPRRNDWLGALLSLAGVALVLSRGDPSALLRLHLLTGDLLMLLAVVSWSLYSWLLARPPASMMGEQRPPWNWAEFLLAQILFGVLWSGASAGVEAAVSSAAWHWNPWLPALLLYVAVGPSLIAYRCWGLGVATVGPAVAAFFSNLTPAFAAVMSAALLGEPPHGYHFAAFAFIVAGIVLSSRR